GALVRRGRAAREAAGGGGPSVHLRHVAPRDRPRARLQRPGGAPERSRRSEAIERGVGMSDRIEQMLRVGGDSDGVGEALERFLASAEGSGLVDVAYARADSPFGELLVAATPSGLVRIGFLHTGTADEVVGA